MKAAVLHDVRDIRVEEVKKPEIAEDEVLIEVKTAGICGTDLHFYKGEWKVDMPIIPGHEFSGVIAEVGENVDGFKIGEHVVAEPNITCGSCYFCLMSERNFFCENLKAVGVTVNGAFAEYLKIKDRNLYRIPENLSFEEAALIEPLACCIRGLDNVGIKAGESVLIVGAGPIGLLLMQLIRNFGASMIIQTDLEDYRLEKALELGADHVINVRKEDPIKVIKELTGGYGVDVAIEAVGSPKAITQAVEAVRKGGRVNIFGVSPQDAVWQVKPFDLYSKELTITTSYRSPYTFQRAVKMASSGRLKLKPLISHIFPLEKIAEAFEILDKKLDNVMKVILKPS